MPARGRCPGPGIWESSLTRRMIMVACVRALVLSFLLLGSLACSDDGDDDAHEAEPNAAREHDAAAEPDAQVQDSGPPDAGHAPLERADLQELLDIGIDKYLGAAEPIGSEMISGVSGVNDGSIVYDFDPADGPVCLRGAPYNVSLLDQGSDNLVIYLQGGGACVSLLCRATTEAMPRGVPKRGVLDPEDGENPVGTWNILYVPYCDGSVFGGDLDFEDPNDAMGVRLHHGQRNFAAALDLALEHFPNPKKVLLAGSSAGGWGTIYHRALVRSQYPDAELSVFNDAGIGFSVNMPFVADEWGSGPFARPASCADCQTDANLSPFVKYLLEHDPSTVVGDFSAWEDSVIMSFTFNSDPAVFRKLLKDETDIPAGAFPERYKRFFIAGSMHTTLMSGFHTTQVNGITVADWLGMMIERDPGWVELIE